MSVPFQQSAFSLGECSPSLFGRQDLARAKVGASTARNVFVKYTGGLYSRAGTAFTGFSKQTGRSFPPRMVPFQFSLRQGLALEFGHFYMRVVENGAYVTEGALAIDAITNTSPAVLTVSTGGVASATANVGAVTRSYKPGDNVTMAGGTFGSPAVLGVTNTQVTSATVSTPGTGYVPADTITTTGGTFSVAAVLTVATTQVVSATVTAAGAGGTDGQQTVTGTTGTGTKFKALVQVTAGAIASVISISTPGSYTVNPTVPAAEPVTGGAVVGGQLNVVLGVRSVTVTTPGVYTVNPHSGVLAQNTTSGSGVGAVFAHVLMGPLTLSVVSAGSYSAFPVNPAAQASTTGVGVGATYTLAHTAAVQPYSVGDWLYIAGVGGMVEINGATGVVASTTTSTVTLNDVYGNPLNTATMGAFTGGGTVARIYTAVSPYAETDLAWLKWTQSADVMSLCLVNQDTNSSYVSYDLKRFSDTNWVFTQVQPAESIDAPTNVVVNASGSGASTYAFVVTAVAADGSESLASAIGFSENAVDIYATAGTITVMWAPGPVAVSYNVYQAAISFAGVQPDGTPYGIVATGVLGTSWQNSNTLPDFTRVPPQFYNPFPTARDQPSVVQYFQQRRVYANSLNHPDQYEMSQPGAFTNFDRRTPPVDDDGITGAPWVTQVDGIQFMVDMPGGLVVLTGREAWQLTGGGGSFAPSAVTPTNQTAQPQAFNGCSSHIPPIRIDYDILYVQAKGSIVRDLSYSVALNIYTGVDITLNSSHLFLYYQLQEWCWSEEPYKLIWVVRTDGALLSCCFVKPEQITAWTRHDTQGSFVSICSVVEPPVDAVYVACQRKIGVHTAYTTERMDNRLWTGVDDAWCVDCARSLAQRQPNATLMIGLYSGNIASASVGDGGVGYSSLTEIVIIDDDGQGSGTGAVITPVITDGVITGLSVSNAGAGYTDPQLTAVDPAGSEGGSGFAGTCVLANTVTLLASAPEWDISQVGDVIRAAGGVATITSFVSSTEVVANVTVPFGNVLPTDNNLVSITPTDNFTPVGSGNWTQTTPVSTVTGLLYLAGASVVGVADGQPFGPLTVSQNGTIPLPAPATNVVVGFSFLPQVQSLYLDTDTRPTVQGQRKKVGAVTVRVEQSRAFQAGSNQVDGSTLSPPQIAPTWSGLATVPDLAEAPFGTNYVPLGTGDVRVYVEGGFNTKAQVALQQPNPLPMNILSLISEIWEGDDPQIKAPQQQQQQRDTVGAS